MKCEYHIECFNDSKDTSPEVEFLARMGREGWRVVGFAHIPPGGVVQYVLEREVAP